RSQRPRRQPRRPRPHEGGSRLTAGGSGEKASYPRGNRSGEGASRETRNGGATGLALRPIQRRSPGARRLFPAGEVTLPPFCFVGFARLPPGIASTVMFVDEVSIHVKAGNGGDGAVNIGRAHD